MDDMAYGASNPENELPMLNRTAGSHLGSELPAPKGTAENWLRRLLGRRKSRTQRLETTPESNGVGAAAGSPAQAQRSAEAAHTPNSMPQTPPVPWIAPGSPGRVTIVSGARERYSSSPHSHQCRTLQQSIENSQTFIAQNAERIPTLQRRLNAARCSYRRLNAVELENEAERDVRQEFERLLSLTGITGFALTRDSLLLKATVRYGYDGALYDFGDWSLNLSWDENNDANKWFSREDRRGFRKDWLNPGCCYKYPVYRVQPGVFCFGDTKQRIEDHLRAGRVAEGVELALACMHFVNSDDLCKIPSAFHLVVDSVSVNDDDVGDGGSGNGGNRESESDNGSNSGGDTTELTFVPDKETVMWAYVNLRTAAARAKLLSAHIQLSGEIAECQSQLDTIKSERAQHEDDIARTRATLWMLQNPSAELLSYRGDEFDQKLNYLRNLAGVTRIDFRGGSMILSVAIRFIQQKAFYDLGDWDIYLGRQHISDDAETVVADGTANGTADRTPDRAADPAAGQAADPAGHSDQPSDGASWQLPGRDFTCYRIENKRPGMNPFEQRPLPPEKQIDLSGAAADERAIGDYLNADCYLEAAALIIADMYRLGEQRVTTTIENNNQR
jgi:hypothetical protein